jgi:hypothetical protein
MFCTFTLAVFRDTNAMPNMAVYRSSLLSCFLVMLFRYCLGDFEMVPVAPVITGIAFSHIPLLLSLSSSSPSSSSYVYAYLLKLANEVTFFV